MDTLTNPRTKQNYKMREYVKNLHAYLLDKTKKENADIVTISSDEIIQVTQCSINMPFKILSELIGLRLATKEWEAKRVRNGEYAVKVNTNDNDNGLLNQFTTKEKIVINYLATTNNAIRVRTLSDRLAIEYYELVALLKELKNKGVVELMPIKIARLWRYDTMLTKEWRGIKYLL